MSENLFVGIDLGTTNITMSYYQAEDLARIFPIHQLTGPGLVSRENVLPAAIYLPSEEEFAASDLALPWGEEAGWVCGNFALKQASRAPHRTILSTKSWLCADAFDRRQGILPHGSDIDQKISPLEATSRLLLHVRNSWNHAQKDGEVPALLEDLDVVLTIPASFEPAARELTLEAAKNAGLTRITLLEEPQSALYAWLNQHEDWRSEVKVNESILVVDIGGGTTDFSLIEAQEVSGNLELRRVRVGPHILLGGDNLDMALAYAASARLSKKPDSRQMQALIAQSREAKEALLSDPAKEQIEIVLAGSGSSLFGGSLKTCLNQEDLKKVLGEGYFKPCEASERPQEVPKAGLRQAGLPFASDPLFARHLASFLKSGEGDAASPAMVLFNGSMFVASQVRDYLLTILKKLAGDQIRELQDADYRHAVAHGAAHFGAVKAGKGLRIRASLPYSYYVGVEKAVMAIPGMEPSLSLVCVAPKGLEEGSSASISDGDFQLIANQTVSFRLFRHPLREDEAGFSVDEAEDQFEEVSHLETRIDEGSGVIPVAIQAHLLEIGILKLECVSQSGDKRTHQLEFTVKADAPSGD